jgi:hypothetical protein
VQHHVQHPWQGKEDNMKATETGPDRPVTAAAGEKFDVFESVTQLYTGGIKRFAEVQKKALDLAVEHNAEFVSAWKKQTQAAPGIQMLDLASTAFERFADTQKAAIDLIVEQSRALAGLVKERKFKATDTLDEVKARTQEVIEHSVAAQKTALDYTTKQAKAVFETAKQQLGYAGTPVETAADTMQRGMDIVVEAQKELLDVIKGPTVH